MTCGYFSCRSKLEMDEEKIASLEPENHRLVRECKRLHKVCILLLWRLLPLHSVAVALAATAADLRSRMASSVTLLCVQMGCNHTERFVCPAQLSPFPGLDGDPESQSCDPRNPLKEP